MAATCTKPAPYRGRFAPTPSGPLHAGSLMTALASWLYARKAGGAWLLRIDDLDTARCQQRHADTLLKQLEAHGLYWDEAPCYQSRGRSHYATALAKLGAAGRLYACSCTRATLQRDKLQGPDGPVYNGHCRDLSPAPTPARSATRFRVGSGTRSLDDGLQGYLVRNIETDIGDFVVQRADRVIGYHLACAVDEAELGITEVVRGADLIGATFCQQLLQDALDFPSPVYRHLPLLRHTHGQKLSKQNHAPPVNAAKAGDNLCTALQQLGQVPPSSLQREPPRIILAWALLHWHPEQIPHPTPPLDRTGGVVCIAGL